MKRSAIDPKTKERTNEVDVIDLKNAYANSFMTFYVRDKNEIIPISISSILSLYGDVLDILTYIVDNYETPVKSTKFDRDQFLKNYHNNEK